METMTTIELNILDGGIHCGGCESRIESALRMLPGVLKVKADRTTQKVQVTLSESHIELEALARKIEFLGYQVAPPG